MIQYKYMWSAAFHLGYFSNRDVKELLDLGVIDVFYEMLYESFLESIELIDCSVNLKIKLIEMRRNIKRIRDTANQYEFNAKKNNIFIISEDDPDYPYYWKCFSGMPRMIYGRGKRSLIDTDLNGSVAIVGSRQCSNYSKVATIEFTNELIKKGISIVSGMAAGIDRVAHETALMNGGKTIAFLAGGVDSIYPWINKDIYDELIKRGLVLSEMPPGTKAQKQYFPSRNRLISALSDTCLIMEAGMHSGTLHTASFAAAQGKTVFVLPNTIYSEESRGSLELIADGASILITPQSVINEVSECCYNKLIAKGQKIEEIQFDDKNEASIYEKIISELSVKPRSADELVKLISVSYSELSVLLSEMEIKGRIIVERGKYALTM